MDVLVVGGGGREHALVWGLARSASVDTIYCAPGNAGIGSLATRWDIAGGNVGKLTQAAIDHQVDLVVVGPEAPLAGGLADHLVAEGIACFGPSRRAAVIEGSKAFAKQFMARHDIPTAAFEVFDDLDAADRFVAACPWGYPVVVKADGLAAGKGVVICANADEARAAVRAAMEDSVFGRAGDRLVVEAFMSGTEATCMALCDGETAVPLLVSQDHKPAFDNDMGPNTGGMGAYAPASRVLDDAAAGRVFEEIIQPVVTYMAQDDRPFSGVLYTGLMLTDAGPQVLEFNCRFGDPEAQAIIPLIDEDFGERLMSIANGEGVGPPINWSGKSAACVVLAAEGYPGNSPQGLPIQGLETVEGRDDVVVFHAATARDDGQVVTSGGRVLGVTGLGDSLDTALDAAYGAIDKITFQGMHFRRDIGRRGARSQ